MQIAVIADIHGNWPSLVAAMAEIRRLGADRVYCLGDIVNPMPSSRRVFDYLMSLDMPSIRGNHEDYIINYFEDETHDTRWKPQFGPVRLVASTFDHASIAKMKSLPLQIPVSDPRAGDLLLCHASPTSNVRGWRNGIVDPVARDVDETFEPLIVCGHWHDPRTTYWKDKTLVTAGSVGRALSGKVVAEFLMLEAGEGAWRHEHMEVPYDVNEAVDEYVSSGWLRRGGPMAWLLLYELITAERRVAYFFQWLKTQPYDITREKDHAEAARAYLELLGKWDLIEHYLRLGPESLESHP